METLKWIKEWKRMCDANEICATCPAMGLDCNCLDGKDIEKIVPIVEQWSKEHPRNTRQDAFLEHYPNAPKDKQGVLWVCPRHIEGYSVCALYYKTNDKEDMYCNDCRREYWTAEVDAD